MMENAKLLSQILISIPQFSQGVTQVVRTLEEESRILTEIYLIVSMPFPNLFMVEGLGNQKDRSLPE
jgi:hypothetical protein